MVFFLLVVLLLIGAHAEAAAEPHCSSADWFAMNVYSLVMQPLVDRTTFVMAPAAVGVALPIVCAGAGTGDETCAALGVAHGIDVIAVALRILLGWRLPLVQHDYCVFDACPTLATLHTLPDETSRTRCRLATRTMRCAWERWHWGAAYIVLALVLLATLHFIVFFTAIQCTWG